MYFEVTIAKAKKNLVLYLTLYSLLNLKGTEKLPLMSCTCADPSPQGILFQGFLGKILPDKCMSYLQESLQH